MASLKERRCQYEAKFKRSVILFAEEHGNREAARKFTICEKNVRRWRSVCDRLFATKGTKKAFRGPKTGLHPEVEEIVKQYVLDMRAQSKPVTR